MNAGRARHFDAAVATCVGLAARLAAVAWAGGGAMPGDAQFYRELAGRLAEGHGYTWRWPDGAVTAAAHYPVGFPAILAGFDRACVLVGSTPGDMLRHPWAAQAFAAVLSAAAVPFVFGLVARSSTTRRAPLVAGLLAALHPGLVLYAPALMSEGPTATLLAAAAWMAARARDAAAGRWWAWIGALGVTFGAATLVRPQTLALAPAFALLALASREGTVLARLSRSLVGAGVALVLAVAVCAPWTARNCREMKRCALVSVNGGWNLLIGTEPSAGGGWAELKTPEPCRTVWSEADKDACFEREARAIIAREPGRWLALVPAKLAATFDYSGAGPWWLHASRPARFGPTAKVASGAVETAFERLALIAGAIAIGRRGPKRAWSRFFVVVAVVFALQLHAWPAFLALALAAFGLEMRSRGALLAQTTGAAIVGTMAVHAVFFGGGRYQVVLFPLVTALAALAFEKENGAVRPGGEQPVEPI